MAERGICAKLTRVLFIILNFIFLLLGVGLIGGGSYLVATGNSLQVFSGPLGAVGLSAIIIVVGILVMILGALGIIGGFMQHKVPLGIYIVALALVIIAELALAIVAIVKKDDLNAAIDVNIGKIFDNYAEDNKTDITTINFVQKLFVCCGWNSSMDYVVREAKIPDSCDCTNNSTGNCNSDVAAINRTIWSIGCKTPVRTKFSTYLGVVIALAIVVALIEMLAVGMALGLCCCSGEKNSYQTV